MTSPNSVDLALQLASISLFSPQSTVIAEQQFIHRHPRSAESYQASIEITGLTHAFWGEGTCQRECVCVTGDVTYYIYIYICICAFCNQEYIIRIYIHYNHHVFWMFLVWYPVTTWKWGVQMLTLLDKIVMTIKLGVPFQTNPNDTSLQQEIHRCGATNTTSHLFTRQIQLGSLA